MIVSVGRVAARFGRWVTTMRVLVLLLCLAGTGPAAASLSSFVSAWGHDFSVTPFEPREAMVAVATDKATGRRFNVMKMGNGHLMAVVPFDAMTAPPAVDAKDLM